MTRQLLRYQINMDIIRNLSRLSTCDRAHVGALLFDPKTKHILSTGYNGSLPGHPHCDDIGHLISEGHCVRTVHAEINCLMNSHENLRGMIMFVTHFPCVNCTKQIIASGVSRVVYDEAYRVSEEAKQLFISSNIIFESWENVQNELRSQS
jgi:dCMP deaminase